MPAKALCQLGPGSFAPNRDMLGADGSVNTVCYSRQWNTARQQKRTEDYNTDASPRYDVEEKKPDPEKGHSIPVHQTQSSGTDRSDRQ